MNIIDMHCDTLYLLRAEEKEGKAVSLRSGTKQLVSLEKMKKGDYMLQNFAAFVELEEAKAEYPESEHAPYLAAKELVRIFKEQTSENPDLIAPVRSFEQLRQNEQAGRMSAMLTLEEGGVCCGSVEKLREFYGDGARMMTLTWNYENEIGYPAAMQPQGSAGYHPGEKREFGLKEKGLEFLAEMERLGMIVDVSHLSDDGFFDVCEHTAKPFVASHSNARALCGHQRNLSDEMLRMLGERGGAAGLNFCPGFVIAEQNPDGTRTQDGRSLLEFLACHAVHMMDVGGSACVGLGSDFDGFQEPGQPEDAASIGDFAWALHRLHVSDDRIDDILYRNLYRLYRELL